MGSQRRLTGRRVVAGMVIGVGMLVLASLGFGALRATDSSCGEIEAGELQESEVFTPFANMLTQPIEAPLNPNGEPAVSATSIAGNVLNGHPRQWAVRSGSGVYEYFASERISATTTFESFMATGGIELDSEPQGAQSVADIVAESAGERAIRVDIGPYSAALTWADPLANGVRTHDLYWSDGRTDFSLISVVSAAEVVNMARSLVCH